MNLGAIEQRSTDLFLVAGDARGGTITLFDGIAIESTRAPVRIAVVCPFLYTCPPYAASFKSTDEATLPRGGEETKTSEDVCS